jgi:hypothetical protein
MGLDATGVRKSAVPLRVPDDAGGQVRILVMHPERCMESRVHTVVGLRRTGPIALTQMRRSIDCAREWSRYLLQDESVWKTRRVRAVLDLNERIFAKCLRSHVFRRLVLEHGIEPFDAVLVDDCLAIKFRERRYPQMATAIETARERARRHRDRHAPRG